MKRSEYTEKGKNVTEVEFNKLESTLGCGMLGVVGALAVYGVVVTAEFAINLLGGGGKE